jgi:hypothetical protein
VADEKKPASSYKPSAEDADAIGMAVKSTESCERDWHNVFAAKVEKRWSAYRGLKQQEAEESQDWRSKVYQPHLIAVVEGMLATLVENEPSWDLTPMTRPGEPLEQVEARISKAEIAEAKLKADMHRDRFITKQRPFIEQDLIAGFTVAKQRRLRTVKDRRYLVPGEDIVYDEAGGSIDVVTSYEEAVEKSVVICDGPTMEVRDVRDWMVPGSATSLETTPYVVDRVWVTLDTLRKLAAQGVYENVEYVSQTAQSGTQAVREREQKLRNIDRTKGLVEVIELWTPETVITVANRTVLLKSRANDIYWHGSYPFVVTSSMPEMFQIPGISVVEGLAQLQDMLWTLQNIRLDALRTLANPITLIRSDVDDPNMYEFAPLAQWVVDDPQQVQLLAVDPTTTKLTLEAESLLKGDIAQLMGGLPFSSGAQSQTVDQTTATGVSIITNIAQQILASRRQQFLWAFEQIGQQFLSISQKSMRENEVVHRPGPYGMEPMEISPEDIQGDYDVRIRMAAESMIRREERAEWQSLLTVALQGGAPSAQMGAPLNIKAFWEGLLRSFDIPNPESFFLPSAPVMGAPGQQVPGQQVPGMGSPPSQNGQGGPVGAGTNPDLAALGGQTAPTNPEQEMMARASM